MLFYHSNRNPNQNKPKEITGLKLLSVNSRGIPRPLGEYSINYGAQRLGKWSFNNNQCSTHLHIYGLVVRGSQDCKRLTGWQSSRSYLELLWASWVSGACPRQRCLHQGSLRSRTQKMRCFQINCAVHVLPLPCHDITRLSSHQGSHVGHDFCSNGKSGVAAVAVPLPWWGI